MCQFSEKKLLTKINPSIFQKKTRNSRDFVKDCFDMSHDFNTSDVLMKNYFYGYLFSFTDVL